MSDPHFDWSDDTPLDQAVFEALGGVSVCWENIDQAGVFQSGRALEIGHELVAFLQRRMLEVSTFVSKEEAINRALATEEFVKRAHKDDAG